ncbi:MAG: hypothetical protein GYA62_02270 [Bacteroidales bacterium]|nr:hypothetical protein [Bacteroidales bacterium]
MILFFKKYKDTNNGSDWSYNSNCLAIDDNFSNLKINIPERKINEIEIYGQGAVITPTPFFENRKISFTYRFKKNNNTIFTNQKDNLFLNWFFNTSDDIYLVRNTEKGLQKIKGVFKINANEKYKSYAISDEIDIQFITEDAFFESVIEKSYTANFTTDEVTINFVNNGFFVSFVIEYNNANYVPDVSFYYNNEFFKIYLSESQLKMFSFDFKSFKFYKNGINFYPTFTGSPFFLQNGSGQMIIKSTGRGNVTLKFVERFI